MEYIYNDEKQLIVVEKLDKPLHSAEIKMQSHDDVQSQTTLKSLMGREKQKKLNVNLRKAHKKLKLLFGVSRFQGKG